MKFSALVDIVVTEILQSSDCLSLNQYSIRNIICNFFFQIAVNHEKIEVFTWK